MLVVTTMKVKPTYELVISFLWQWCPLVFTAASTAGATGEHASKDLSHPVQRKFQHLNKGCGTTVGRKPHTSCTSHQGYQPGLSGQRPGISPGFHGHKQGFSVTAGSRWNSQAISHELAAYFSLEITPVFTDNMIYICKTDNETTNGSKLLARRNF